MTVLLVSSNLIDASLLRVTIHPSKSNGLKKPSQVIIDKAMTVKRDKLGESFGSATDEAMLEISRCLAIFLGVAK